jgi:hypothetical protein
LHSHRRAQSFEVPSSEHLPSGLVKPFAPSLQPKKQVVEIAATAISDMSRFMGRQ